MAHCSSSREGSLLCPITSQVKGYPFEVALPRGLPVRGVVLADQVKNLDWRVRKASHACKVSQATVSQVVRKLAVLLTIV